MRRLLVFALSAAALLSACSSADNPDAGAGGPPGGMPPLPVESAQVAVRAWASSFETVGSLRADESVLVRPEVAGRIEKIGFSEGGEVRAGQLLFALDASTAQAAAHEAKVNLETARVAMQRAQELVGRKLISQSEFDLARAQFSVSEARLASARTQLAKMTLHAPFAGRVGLRQVSVGDFVNAGQDLVSLVQLDPIEVDFSAPETLLGQLREGQAVSLQVDAFASETFKGTLVAIDPVVDPNSRSVHLRAQVTNADQRLRPGQFARLTLDTGDAGSQSLMMPEQALMQDGDVRYVYAVVDGKAKKTTISTGRRLPGLVEVLQGLKAGDEVITAGQSKPMIFDGAAVAPIPADAEQPATETAKDG